MSPILVRPVREQFEHDRVIRLLQLRYKRKFEVVINPGPEQNASVMSGELAVYPDLVLYSQDRGRKLQGTVEVETGESVNTLEAMAQWAPFGRLRAPFHLYVPPHSLDTARRLCAEHHVSVSEIWTYHMAADQVRFTMVHRAPDAPVAKEPKVAKETKPAGKEPKPAKETKPAAVKKAPPVKKAKAKATKTAKPAKKTAAKKATPVKKSAKPAKKAARRR